MLFLRTYQNDDTFYLVYKRKGDSQATLPQDRKF